MSIPSTSACSHPEWISKFLQLWNVASFSEIYFENKINIFNDSDVATNIDFKELIKSLIKINQLRDVINKVLEKMEKLPTNEFTFQKFLVIAEKRVRDRESKFYKDMFLEHFNKASEDYISIIICEKNIFNKLGKRGKKKLNKLIWRLGKDDYLIQVIGVVVHIFEKYKYEYNIDNVTFPNFLSIAEFVAACVGQEVAKITHQQVSENEFFIQKQNIINNLLPVAMKDNIFLALQDLRLSINRHTNRNPISPDFRDDFSAAYHYCKHKNIPNTETVLSLEEYYLIINDIIYRVKELSAYNELCVSQSRKQLKFEIFCLVREQKQEDTLTESSISTLSSSLTELRGGTISTNIFKIRIVIKSQPNNNSLVLSTFYFLDEMLNNHSIGDEFLDSKLIGLAKEWKVCDGTV